jgi:hypothetical protein
LLALNGEYFKLVQRQLKKKNSIIDADGDHADTSLLKSNRLSSGTLTGSEDSN